MTQPTPKRYYYTCPLKAAQGNGSAEIIMTDGTIVLVSACDFDELNRYRWSPSPSGKKIYASTSVKKDKWRKVYLHRMLVSPKSGQQVDHINGDSLDNRRENLRLCRPEQNSHNRGKNGGKQYKGVRKQGNRYRMTISKTFKTQEQAAQAYDEIARYLFGEFAYQNNASNGEAFHMPEVEE